MLRFRVEFRQYTPEEIAQLEKSRTISDAELLKRGAEYSVNEKGEKENLLVSEDIQKKLSMDHRIEVREEQLIPLIKAEEERIHTLISSAKESGMFLFGTNERGGLDSIPVRVIFRTSVLKDVPAIFAPMRAVFREESGPHYKFVEMMRDKRALSDSIIPNSREGTLELMRFSERSVTLSTTKPDGLSRDSNKKIVIGLENIESIERLDK